MRRHGAQCRWRSRRACRRPSGGAQAEPERGRSQRNDTETDAARARAGARGAMLRPDPVCLEGPAVGMAARRRAESQQALLRRRRRRAKALRGLPSAWPGGLPVRRGRRGPAARALRGFCPLRPRRRRRRRTQVEQGHHGRGMMLEGRCTGPSRRRTRQRNRGGPARNM